MRASTVACLCLTFAVALGCGFQAPLECKPGGKFAASTEQATPRSSATEPLVLSGTVRSGDGAALSGQPVLLDRLATADEWATLVLFAPLVLADCATAKTSGLCDDAQSVSTDAQSRYRFEVAGEPVDGTHSFALFATLPAGTGQLLGPSLARTVAPKGQSLELGELRFWNPALELSMSGDRLGVTASDGRCEGDEAVELVSETGERWLTVRNGSVDARLLDDSAIGARLVAEVGSTRYTSGAAAFGGQQAPASRGASCTVTRDDGTSAVESPCRLTDGRGDRTLAREVASVVLEVPSATSYAVGVRGYGTLSAKVEVSADGASWHTAEDSLSASGVARDGVLSVSAARWVRLTPSQGAKNSLGRIFEVLVW